VRRARGNIILTAIFIAIFLFFLSVALIWTNRQDIALSLSMEHKLKAQSAARSAAYEAFYRLREFGELDGFATGTLDSGASYEIELVGLEPLGKRGEVLLLRARGKSGPVTSYLTLHLRDTRIASEENSGDSRVLFFPSASLSAEVEAPEDVASAPLSKAVFGDFKSVNGGAGVEAGMVANAGPAFLADEASPLPPSFRDFIPVFGGPFLRAWGPIEVIAPETFKGGTSLRILEYIGEEFKWKQIDPPTELGDPPLEEGSIQQAPFQLGGPPAGKWTTSTVQGNNMIVQGEVKTMAYNVVWTEEKPPTVNASDIENPLVSTPEPVGVLIPWGSQGTAQVQHKYETRGSITSLGDTVYTHAWHFLYLPYNGAFPDPDKVTFLDGSTLIRWPCVLKYNPDGGWDKVWDPLQPTGSVESEYRPDSGVIAVTSNETIYSVTEADPDEPDAPRRLLTLSGKKTTLGDPVPDGQIVVYQDSLYLVGHDPSRPALTNLVQSGQDIDFQSLPGFIPEIAGEVVDTTGTETLILNIDGGYSGEPLDSTKRLTYTARPRYDFRYNIKLGSTVAIDGNDLWTLVDIETLETEPTFEKGYLVPPFDEEVRTTLARYDGERWHILPNGLRTCLKNPSLGPPGAGVVAALYPGLPAQVSRYSIISVDTDPF
jgi:hypothetical protein